MTLHLLRRFPKIRLLIRISYSLSTFPHSPHIQPSRITPLIIALLPLILFRLLLSLVILRTKSSLLNIFTKYHFVVLLRREGFNSDIDSDYRFPFLLRSLCLSGTCSIIYHGSLKPFFNHPLSLHLSDLFIISRLLVDGASIFKPRPSQTRQHALTIVLSSLILASALSRHDRVFYWDFNPQHSPLLLAAWFRGCLRVGSIHALHDSSTTPWCFESHPLHHLISGTFLSLHAYMPDKSVSSSIQITSPSTHAAPPNAPHSTSIVILEEHFSGEPTPSQHQLAYLLQHCRPLFEKIYFKPRQDRAFTVSYLDYLRSSNLSVECIDQDFIHKHRDTIAVATKGSYPHDLALLGINVILVTSSLSTPPSLYHNPAHVSSLNDFIRLLSLLKTMDLPLTDQTLAYWNLRRHSSLMVYKSLNHL